MMAGKGLSSNGQDLHHHTNPNNNNIMTMMNSSSSSISNSSSSSKAQLRARQSRGEGDKGVRGADHWRSVVDNVIIEFLASLFIVFSTVLYGGGGTAEGGVAIFKDPCKTILLLHATIIILCERICYQ